MKSITVAIPTFNREKVLIETLDYITRLSPRADDILVVDQTGQHEPETTARLRSLIEKGSIRLFKQPPSIPSAMNRAIIECKTELLLFVDDDIIPCNDLLLHHSHRYNEENTVAVVGQVLQPGESPIDFDSTSDSNGLLTDLKFCFRQKSPATVRNVMAGNLSVKRTAALAAGGFDENFVGVAYRFETEFARRLTRLQGDIRYEPNASIRHLAAAKGGTRSFGRHHTSATANHSVGDYYFAMLEGKLLESVPYCLNRFVFAAATRFHATHPWWILPKLIGELRGFLWALKLKQRGQNLIGVAKQ